MLKNLLKNFIKFSLFFLPLLFLTSISAHSAEDYIPTNEIIKEIEKTLIFDDEDRQKIDIYRKKKTRKSEFTIDHEENLTTDSAEESPYMQTTITNGKTTNFDVLEKQKMAYNAVLSEQYEVAIELYKNVLMSDRGNLYAKFSLAVVYQKIGQFRQAKKLYSELLKLDPKNRQEIVENLLTIMVEEAPRDAVYLLLRLSSQNPQSPYIAAQTGMAYNKVKNYERAIYFLKKAIGLDPERIDYKYNLAIIYDKTAQYGKAVEVYSDVIKNYSEANQFIPIEQVKSRMESIKNK
jgi:tetratricopeptide (TPR) repeat protein